MTYKTCLLILQLLASKDTYGAASTTKWNTQLAIYQLELDSKLTTKVSN